MTDARLDAELVRRGLARSRRAAVELVAQGLVSLDGEIAHKASQPVSPSDAVDVVAVPGSHYVSRAAHKLAGALDAIDRLDPGAVRVHGAQCLDAGASTGGFTQVLLERGARHVDAVDVGHGQIAPVVAGDPRVTVREGVNVRDLTPAGLTAAPDLVVADLSFISLTLVTAGLVALAAPGGTLLLMVKPQFEVGRERLGAGGVVTSASLRAETVHRVATSAVEAGVGVRGVVPSPLPGPSGNHEYFLWLGAPGASRGGRSTDPDRIADAVQTAVRTGQAVAL